MSTCHSRGHLGSRARAHRFGATRRFNRWCLAFLALAWTAAFAPRAAAEDTHLQPQNVLPARIDEIEIRQGGGLWTTQSFVLRRELPWKVGEQVSLEDWEIGVRRLWNTQIFSRVDGWLESRGGRTVAVFQIEERWSLIPAFELMHGGKALWLRAGLSEHNLFGRYLQVDALYEYFDGQHGGILIYRDPRFLDRRLELRAQASRTMRPRPDFVVQRALARVEVLRLERDDTIRFGAAVQAFDDQFLPSIDERATGAPRPSAMQTFGIEPSLRFGRVDSKRVQYSGVSFETRPHVHVTIGDGATPFGGIMNELLAFRTAWRFTFALRARAAVQTRTAGAQLDYWLGGLDTIRGYRDNFTRANVYGLGNAEVRFVAFDTDWLACELAIFADASASRAPLQKTTSTFGFGPGIRFFIPKLVDSELRFDFPFAIVDGRLRGELAIGTEPFF